MNEVLKCIHGHCSSPIPNTVNYYPIFAVLTDVIPPDQFVPYTEYVSEIFTADLMATDASRNLSSPVILHSLLCRSFSFWCLSSWSAMLPSNRTRHLYPGLSCHCKHVPCNTTQINLYKPLVS